MFNEFIKTYDKSLLKKSKQELKQHYSFMCKKKEIFLTTKLLVRKKLTLEISFLLSNQVYLLCLLTTSLLVSLCVTQTY